MHNNSSASFDKIAALIVAAGRGTRVGSGDTPKQYRLLHGKMVLTQTLLCFQDFPTICVVIHPDDQNLFDQCLQALPKGFPPVQSVIGGATRSLSVAAGLDYLQNSTPKYVLIHDAARPFLKSRTIQNVLDGLENHQACVPCLPITDAVKTRDGTAVDRSSIVKVQTPQGFHFAAIHNAFAKRDAEKDYADDIEIAKEFGLSITMCDGDPMNSKLTFAADFDQNTPMISVTGSGYDVHRICEGKTLWLGGVEIEAGFSLLGHSDADVALHAITDAVLGAIAEGDIGDHFPPSDDQWKNARSDVFLKHAIDLTKQKSAMLDHVDVTIICEQPKIKPHREAIRQTLSDLCKLPLSRISVKATTTEKLGFTGRGEGISASAVVSVRIPQGTPS